MSIYGICVSNVDTYLRTKLIFYHNIIIIYLIKNQNLYNNY